ncbi:MAG: 4-(cytidine 5'-diphospho)-2-C-methyl-D-erythritol kinase [Xanthomonadaceae bacterium]|nr:4-(cytidine 5'-diphospho)-2-C-methyl-D-erythritol kinase [Xanthomonadaceae bacterium]
MKTVEALAPAKLNLFLHVTGRRDDGYHDLQTVFQFVDLCDLLRFTPRDDDRIERVGGLPDVAPADDLAVRAAFALREAAGNSRGMTIEVRKSIPAGGGLGGGSSDAATTLVTLNRMWGLGWSVGRLAALGLTLGADVPVFVHGYAAWAEGVGDRLVPIELPEPWYLLVDPGISVPTDAVFQAPELTRDSPRLTISDFVSGGGRNDFEPVVRARYPEVAAALDWLAGHGGGRLTGTGGCVFGTFTARDSAEAAYDALPDGWRGVVARGLNRSPLYAPIGA